MRRPRKPLCLFEVPGVRIHHYAYLQGFLTVEPGTRGRVFASPRRLRWQFGGKLVSSQWIETDKITPDDIPSLFRSLLCAPVLQLREAEQFQPALGWPYDFPLIEDGGPHTASYTLHGCGI